jgi:hypothetical protein
MRILVAPSGRSRERPCAWSSRKAARSGVWTEQPEQRQQQQQQQPLSRPRLLHSHHCFHSTTIDSFRSDCVPSSSPRLPASLLHSHHCFHSTTHFACSRHPCCAIHQLPLLLLSLPLLLLLSHLLAFGSAMRLRYNHLLRIPGYLIFSVLQRHGYVGSDTYPWRLATGSEGPCCS